jgi:hypothetical protein
MYMPGETYWGLGLELETYVECVGGAEAPADFCLKHQGRERYSVDYWTQYKSGAANSALLKWLGGLKNGGATQMRYPLLMNAHTFTKTDRCGQHATTYTKCPEANPKFCGRTLLEDLSGMGACASGHNIWWTFDGDTIEFMTQGFYNAKMEDILLELQGHKTRWLGELQRGLDALPEKEVALRRRVCFPDKNHGLAVFLTNRQNIGIFNNGTYHINITLPTYLDKDCHIADRAAFTSAHQRLARLFQWLSPFLVAAYGTGDVFSGFAPAAFPAGSQRLCASRFVSVGTYDTHTMMCGKVLHIPYERITGRWYEQIYDKPECSYTKLPQLGLDINFNKHWNHGLEFRIFDWFPEKYLPDLFRCLIWMCDESLAVESVPNPQSCAIWNSVLADAVWKGRAACLNSSQTSIFASVFRVPLSGSVSLVDAYKVIWKTWAQRWNNSLAESCSSKMIRRPLDAAEIDAGVQIPTSMPSVPVAAPVTNTATTPSPVSVTPPPIKPANQDPESDQKRLIEIVTPPKRSWWNFFGCVPRKLQLK